MLLHEIKQINTIHRPITAQIIHVDQTIIIVVGRWAKSSNSYFYEASELSRNNPDAPSKRERFSL